MRKGYRPAVARSIQLSTFRYKSQVLKFQKKVSFVLTPQIHENYFLNFRANCMRDIIPAYAGHDAPGTWTATDASWDSGNAISPDGYTEWSAKYQYSRVLSSKITVTVRNLETGALDPYTVMIIKSPSENYVANSTTLAQLESRPYMVRNYQSSNQGEGSSTRLFSTLSCKKFFGIKDMQDTNNTAISNPGTTGSSTPGKEAFYHLCLTSALGRAQDNLPPEALINVRIEYITQFFGTTSTNIPQPGSAAGGAPAAPIHDEF
jgi:hypothetical protein